MGTQRLPGRIAGVMAGTIVVSVLTVAASVLWMARAFDRDAASHSTELMRAAADGLLRQIATTTLDYARWDEAVRRATVADAGWFYENVGTSAHAGTSANLAIVHGGALPAELGWTDDDVVAPRAEVLAPGDVARLDARLDAVPVGAPEAIARFVRREGRVFAVATARIEPLTGPAPADARSARLVMGRLVDQPVIADLSGQTFLGGLRLATVRPPEGLALPLVGPDGAPVAFIAWEAPAPGGALLRRMLAPLALMLALVTILAATGVALARRSARALVQAEEGSAAAARTDALTGLPNRAAFNLALAASALPDERAMLLVDLNDFKRVNDSIGHAAGDRVIVATGARLGRLRDAGCALFRLGGDEFGLLLLGADAARRAGRLAADAERALGQPLDVMGHRLRIGAAIGWAVQDQAATDGDLLVHRADLALAEAKRRHGSGGGAIGWDAMIEEADRDARAIEAALREAVLARGQIRMVYQPVVDVGSGRIVRAEALARWDSPTLGSVPPDRFIAVAERAGLIIELGRLILAMVCDDLAAHPDLAVAVNVSPLQLMAPTFLPELIEVMERRGIDPHRLEVELTEQVVVDDPRRAARALRELHEAGCTIALDDFGTGYSSIGYLRQMEFDSLKIDRSFVSGFPEAPARLALLQAMIQLAHSIGLRVVCEGIETAEEMDLLADLGCDLAQGWHVGRPMAIEALAARWFGTPGEARASVA